MGKHAKDIGHPAELALNGIKQGLLFGIGLAVVEDGDAAHGLQLLVAWFKDEVAAGYAASD